MQTIMDLRPLHSRALQTAGAVLSRVRTADLVLPTPCAGWELHTLIAHVLGQNHGFASAVEVPDGGDVGVEAFASRPPEPGRISEAWAASADRLALAFGSAPLDRRVRLVEISDDVRFPVATVVGFHLLDTVVHSWDVANTMGEEFRPDDALVAATLLQALQVPGGPARTRPGAAFASALPTGGHDDWADALALLGRN
jgi:uncharacterized protein (TIGR03086 family)